MNPTKKNTIIIVEDELIIAKDMNDILTQEGYDCIYDIDSYASAIEAIQNASPCLVLIDIMLNGAFEGIQIGNYLYNHCNIPYIFISSLHDKHTIQRVKQLMPHGYIVKPFKPADVVTSVSLALHNFKLTKVDVQRFDAPEVVDDVPFQIRKVLNYIHENIVDKIALDELSVMTRWKKKQFIRHFNACVDTTPYQYIIRCKIEKCMALMETTNLTADAISFELGFGSYSSFSKIFKKIAGCTVEEYRRKMMLAKSSRGEMPSLPRDAYFKL